MKVAFKFALRELRGGLGGFRIFIACIILGVAAIAGVGSFAAALQQALQADGQTILGGDLSVSLIHQEPSPEAVAYLDSVGSLSRVKTLRGIVRTEDGDGQTLVEIKAVDSAYPLYGTVQLEGTPQNLDQALAFTDEAFGLVAEATMLASLGVQVGDRVRIGETRFQVRGNLSTEPDRLASGFNFGPRVLMSVEALLQTGLVQPGSLVRTHYRVKLEDASQNNLDAVLAKLKQDFPDKGWRLRERGNAAPNLSENIDRFSQFLTLVALTALIVGGVGVGNGVYSYLQSKTKTIAIFKALGANGRTVAWVYLWQLSLIALGSTLVGLALGASLPPLAGEALNSVLGLNARFGVYGDKLMLAACFGLIITLTFSILPLARTQGVRPASLFRAGVSLEAPLKLRPLWMLALAGCIVAFTALVLGFSTDMRLALSYLGAIGAGIVVLRLVAWGIMVGVAKLPSPKNTALRMAMRNLHRPQAPTPAIVLSLGLGLSLLVSLAMIDAAITRQLTQNLPEKAPDFFFLDIPRSEQQTFADTVTSIASGAAIEMVPMLRGRITAINDIRAEDYNAIPEARWLLEGDRGLTYAAELPKGSTLTQGEWWPADTSENLVSFDDELGAELGLKLGDTLTVNVLGREVSARLVNFRAQEWENLSITFVMQFSPATFKGAPHMVLSTVSLEENAANQDEVLRAVVKAIPTITAIPVRDALEFANGIVKRLASALRGASSVTLITSILVLSGAFAAGYRARAYDAMVLKTLGATRRTLLTILALEYTFLGLIASLFGLIAGIASSWAILTFVMETPFVLALPLALGLALGAMLITLTVGLLATLSVLKQRPAQALRNL